LSIAVVEWTGMLRAIMHDRLIIVIFEGWIDMLGLGRLRWDGMRHRWKIVWLRW
jgi:hypothetical protein